MYKLQLSAFSGRRSALTVSRFKKTSLINESAHKLNLADSRNQFRLHPLAQKLPDGFLALLTHIHGSVVDPHPHETVRHVLGESPAECQGVIQSLLAVAQRILDGRF